MILDVGSGSKGYGTVIARGDICIDIGFPPTKLTNFIRADAHNLPFQNETFERVYFYDVIEHVDSPIKALKEIYRVLKQNGDVEISTPNPLHYRIFLRGLRGKGIILSENSDHIATWTEAELGNILRIVGFRNVQFKFVLLDVTEIADKKHMIYDKSLFKALPNFMRRVTGRNIIAYARKLPYS